MHVKEKPALRLIRSEPIDAASPPAGAAEDRTALYYRRIKSYAERIRGSNDVDSVVRLLERALHETARLHRDRSVQLSRLHAKR